MRTKNILISSFTVDPERDSVGKLKIYAEKHGIKSGWIILTGDKNKFVPVCEK